MRWRRRRFRRVRKHARKPAVVRRFDEGISITEGGFTTTWRPSKSWATPVTGDDGMTHTTFSITLVLHKCTRCGSVFPAEKPHADNECNANVAKFVTSQ